MKLNGTRLILWVSILAYILYFGILSILRYRTLYASYYDLGIMYQTVFNTYRALATFDFSRILEMTNTMGPEQITRMAIHNDILLAFLAPFFLVNSSPAMLLVIQTVVLGLGALVVYNLTTNVLESFKQKQIVAFVFSLAWLCYAPMERSNLYDFHAVVIATTMLIAMYYYWSIRRYRVSLVLFLLSLLAKEQVSLTTALFGIYVLLYSVPLKLLMRPFTTYKQILKHIREDDVNFRFGLSIGAVSVAWFVLSIFVIIPFFRGGHHFAVERYGELGDGPGSIILAFFTNPGSVYTQLMKGDPLRYLSLLLGPLGFLSLLSPLHLLIVSPEFAVNLLSNSANMRNIIYHYTAVIQPFVFISAMYGFRNAARLLSRGPKTKKYPPLAGKLPLVLCALIIVFSSFYSYMHGPLFFAKNREIHPIMYPNKERFFVYSWADQLQDDQIKVSASGQLSPFFTNRRYFYTFSKYYPRADYVIIRPTEVYNYPEKNELIPAYEQLTRDTRFKLVQKEDNFEVYKKL